MKRAGNDYFRACEKSQDTHYTRTRSRHGGSLGGDEFTIVLEQTGKPADAAAVAGKIVGSLASPCVLRGRKALIAPSIGITIYPSDNANVDQLLKNPDTAMYRAKEEGGNSYRFVTKDTDTVATDRLELESGLRHALERDEFVVYYQPKLNLADTSIIGAEALLRWKHPTRGLVSPAEFIPILEKTGLIEQVGAWVPETVCRQIRAWQEAGLPPMVVAVKLSGRQRQRNNLSATIAGILEETGLDPRFLEVEVTENMLMHDPKAAIDTLMQIRAKGVMHIDVDDFGTGYSSMSYLKPFPIDCLKIDKSFVDGLPDDEDDIAISRAVIALAHSLKLTVAAEGVERKNQLEFLQGSGCDVIQGYIVSAPLPALAFAQLVRERMRDGGTTLPLTDRRPSLFLVFAALADWRPQRTEGRWRRAEKEEGGVAANRGGAPSRPSPFQTAKRCLMRSVLPSPISAIRRSMLGCLPGLARASSVCSA